MNNYCINCGKELGKNKGYCQVCGMKVLETRVNIEEIEKMKRKEKIYVALSLLSFFPVLFDLLCGFIGEEGFGLSLNFSAFLYVISMAIIVDGYIKIPKSKVIGNILLLLTCFGVLIYGTLIFFMLLCSSMR